METQRIKLGLIVLSIFITAFLFVAYLSSLQTKKVEASTYSGVATPASSSAQAIGTTARLLFATSTCASRVVSTRDQPVMLGFGEPVGFVPTAVNGVLQPASTTAVYEAETYGCGAVMIISGTVTASTVHVVETR